MVSKQQCLKSLYIFIHWKIWISTKYFPRKFFIIFLSFFLCVFVVVIFEKFLLAFFFGGFRFFLNIFFFWNSAKTEAEISARFYAFMFMCYWNIFVEKRFFFHFLPSHLSFKRFEFAFLSFFSLLLHTFFNGFFLLLLFWWKNEKIWKLLREI